MGVIWQAGGVGVAGWGGAARLLAVVLSLGLAACGGGGSEEPVVAQANPATAAAQALAQQAGAEGAIPAPLLRGLAGPPTMQVQANGSAVAAPVITAQPTAQLAVVGRGARLVVEASGSSLWYQWLVSSDGGASWRLVAGATGNTLSLSGLALADSGRLYAVLISNTGGLVLSSTATLTVSATAVAPTLATNPASLTVNAGQAASFSAQARGTGPFDYQWLRNGTAIAGATAARYSIAATTLADNGARFSVRVTAPGGTVTSGVAVLTVNGLSPLAGRSWQAGQLLVPAASNQFDSARVQSVIDDAGRVTLLYRKQVGNRSAMHVIRGTPNAARVAPTWSAPVLIDGLNESSQGLSPYWSSTAQLAVAPGGDVAVLWDHLAACTASTYNTSGVCDYLYVSRYRVATGAWEAPVLVEGVGLGEGGGIPELVINDQGDMLLWGWRSGWVRSGANGFTVKPALFLRRQGETAFRRQLLDDSRLNNSRSDSFQVRMDNRGNLLLAANYNQNSSTDVVAVRGTVAGGLVWNPTVLDRRASPADLHLSAVGLGGQQAVVWTQSNGTASVSWSAIASSATAPFTISDLGTAFSVGGSFSKGSQVFVTDAGDVLLYDRNSEQRKVWTAANGWGPSTSLPGLGQYSYRVGFDRRGSYLRVATDTVGATRLYDGPLNLPLPSPGYVLGVATAGDNSNPYFYLYDTAYAAPLLSVSGIAFQSVLWSFDTLPSATDPTGDGRPTVRNLWGVYLK